MTPRTASRALTGATLALLLTAPSPEASLRGLGQAGTAPLDPIVDLVALAAWACAAWLLVAVALTTLGRLPGALGRLATVALCLVAPHAVRRVAELVLGVTVATGVLGIAGASAEQRQPPRGAGVQLVSPVSAPLVVPAPLLAGPLPPSVGRAGDRARMDWPTGPPDPASTGSGPTNSPAVGPHPALDWPTTSATTSRRMPAAGTPTAVHGTADVVVQPGDCLWALAGRSLGPGATARRIAATWPSWWAANRTVIGDDPDLLQPGTRLRPPSTSAPGELR